MDMFRKSLTDKVKDTTTPKGGAHKSIGPFENEENEVVLTQNEMKRMLKDLKN